MYTLGRADGRLSLGIAARVAVDRSCNSHGSTSKAIGVAEEHLDRALERDFWITKAEMYPQKYPSIPSVGYAIENGDFG
jgi:hypothetical protein